MWETKVEFLMAAISSSPSHGSQRTCNHNAQIHEGSCHLCILLWCTRNRQAHNGNKAWIPDGIQPSVVNEEHATQCGDQRLNSSLEMSLLCPFVVHREHAALSGDQCLNSLWSCPFCVIWWCTETIHPGKGTKGWMPDGRCLFFALLWWRKEMVALCMNQRMNSWWDLSLLYPFVVNKGFTAPGRDQSLNCSWELSLPCPLVVHRGHATPYGDQWLNCCWELHLLHHVMVHRDYADPLMD